MFLGTLLADGSPLLPHIKSLTEHMYIRGAPGSGKSAMLAFIIELLLTWGNCILHFLDLKDQNSMEIFAAIRAGASRSGTRVLWFVDKLGRNTHTFNLFLQPFWKLLTPMQKAGLVGAALGSTHGLEGYGPQYFGGSAFELLVIVFEHFDVTSWVDLRDKIRLVMARPRGYGLSKKEAEAAGQVKNDVGRVARIPALNTAFSSIDLCSDEPQAVYWSFPGAYDMAGVISRLVLFSLFAAAENSSPQRQRWVAVDEFQRSLGNRIDLLFQQGREKIGLLLANQCLADLKAHNKDFTSTVKTCCRIHWSFNPDEAEQLFMSEVSGKVTRKRITNTYTVGPLGLTTAHTRSYAEVEADRYGFNDVSIAAATPELSIFRCTQDFGFIQHGGFPQVVHTQFHVDSHEYARRKLMPWPNPEEGTITGDMPPLLPEPGPKAPPPINITNPDQAKRPRRAPKDPRP